jgi:hypothetical protein
MTVQSRFLTCSFAAGLAVIPLAAPAQTPSYATHGETIRGTIVSVSNVNHIYVADDRGFTDDVTLRSGAAVFSNGVRLQPGERVTIVGSNGGQTFLASRIATNGRSDYGSSEEYTAPAATAYYPVAAVPVYYPAPVYYPGPYYGYGYGYGISIGIGFGYRGFGSFGYGGYHGGYGGFHGGYGGVHGHFR